MTNAPRHMSLRGSAVLFVLMAAGVVALSMAMLVLLDPRAHEYWGDRIDDFLAWFRALIGR